jgi:hypothetical protein
MLNLVNRAFEREPDRPADKPENCGDEGELTPQAELAPKSARLDQSPLDDHRHNGDHQICKHPHSERRNDPGALIEIPAGKHAPHDFLPVF